MAGAVVISGCMFAGKTEELIRRYREARSAPNTRPVIIAYKADTRYGTGAVRTHNGDSEPAHTALSLTTPENVILARGATHVFVDEGCFYSDLLEFADICATAGTNLVVCGLDLTYERLPFGQILELAARPNSTHVQPRGRCGCGAPAIYTKRRNGVAGGTIIIGGSDIYSAVCSACYGDNITAPAAMAVTAMVDSAEASDVEVAVQC